jgi:hypothetical protein
MKCVPRHGLLLFQLRSLQQAVRLGEASLINRKTAI